MKTRPESEEGIISRRDVLQAVLSTSVDSPKGVIMKEICDEVLSRKSQVETKGKRVVKEFLQEGVELGIFSKDSRRRFTLDSEVSRYVVCEKGSASTAKRDNSSPGRQDPEPAKRRRSEETLDDDATSANTVDLDQEADEAIDSVLYRLGGGSAYGPGSSACRDLEDLLHFDVDSMIDKMLGYLSPGDARGPSPMTLGEEFDTERNGMPALKAEYDLLNPGETHNVDASEGTEGILDSMDIANEQGLHPSGDDLNNGVDRNESSRATPMRTPSTEDSNDCPSRNMYV